MKQAVSKAKRFFETTSLKHINYMKFTLVRVNRAKHLCVSTKTTERLMERITKNEDHAGAWKTFRSNAPFVDCDYDSFVELYKWHRVYPAAEFVKDANGNLQFKSFNGLLLLSFGGMRSEEQLSAAKQAVAQLPMTYAAVVGADGMSLDVMISISKSDGTLPDDEAEAESLYRMAQKATLPIYSAVVSGDNLNAKPSLRDNFIITIDTEPYYNRHAVAMRVADCHTDPSPEMRDVVDTELYKDYEYVYRKTVTEIHAEMSGSGVEWEDYEERHKAFLAALSARLCRKGFTEEEAYIRVKRHYWRMTSPDELRQIVSAAYADEAAEAGAGKTGGMDGRHQGKGRAEIVRMMDLLQKRYVFRYNKVLRCTEFRPNNACMNAFRPLTPRVQKRMTLEVQLADIRVSIKDVRNYLESDMIKNFDPVDDYLYDYCYGKWDGNDHIRALARTVPTNTPQWEDWFYTWFLAMVNQWRTVDTRTYGNSVAPLLISPQGYNKSTFCRSLIPPELQWGYNDNLLLSEKRQVLQAMSHSLLINLDEFNQISPAVQQGFLKNIIQLPTVKIKRPYGTHVEEFPRRASFIATSNLTDILADPSGNRRFIGVELTAPVDVSVKPNHRQLFAQALAALDNHEKAYFDERQTKLLMRHNAQFALVMPIEQYFDEYFEPTTDENAGKYMTTAAIFDYLKHKIGSSVKADSLLRFGRILANRSDIIRRRVSKGTVYLVVIKK